MKKLLILIILFSIHTVNAQQNKNSLIGKWIGVSWENVSGGIEFSINKTAKLLIKDKELSVKEYKIDYSKNPIWVDLIVEKNGQTFTLFGLAEFVDAKTIKWEIFPTRNKRLSFTGTGKYYNTVILKKQ